jgi:hypothetical protein
LEALLAERVLTLAAAHIDKHLGVEVTADDETIPPAATWTVHLVLALSLH